MSRARLTALQGAAVPAGGRNRPGTPRPSSLQGARPRLLFSSVLFAGRPSTDRPSPSSHASKTPSASTRAARRRRDRLLQRQGGRRCPVRGGAGEHEPGVLPLFLRSGVSALDEVKRQVERLADVMAEFANEGESLSPPSSPARRRRHPPNGRSRLGLSVSSVARLSLPNGGRSWLIEVRSSRAFSPPTRRI